MGRESERGSKRLGQESPRFFLPGVITYSLNGESAAGAWQWGLEDPGSGATIRRDGGNFFPSVTPGTLARISRRQHQILLRRGNRWFVDASNEEIIEREEKWIHPVKFDSSVSIYCQPGFEAIALAEVTRGT